MSGSNRNDWAVTNCVFTLGQGAGEWVRASGTKAASLSSSEVTGAASQIRLRGQVECESVH